VSGAWWLRPATSRDLDAIERIEVTSFGNPWPADVYAQEIERDVGHVDVAQSTQGEVIGVSCVWCVAGESHLLRIATAPAYRGVGVGRDLLAAAIARARDAACESMTLEVASSNAAAVQLYVQAGFCVIGRREGYYRAPPDDALVMRVQLSAGTCGPSTAGGRRRARA
jgi:ribosomal-protein-alanine acetyltransferase